MNTSAVFRRVRRAILRKGLIPEGFEETSSAYVRNTPEGQLHCIQFAAAKYGGSFTVDLGFHFTTVPFYVEMESLTELRDVTEACCFQMRLRQPNFDQFFAYGRDPGEAEAIVHDIQGRILAIFRSVEQSWGDGRALIDAIPPAQLAGDLIIFQAIYDEPSIPKREELHDSMHISRLFPGWAPHIFPVAVLLAHLANGMRKDKLAAQYLQVAEQAEQTLLATCHMRFLFQQLLRQKTSD